MDKTQANFKLSTICKVLIAALAQKLGVNKTSVIEMAIRKFAETEKVKAD